MYRTSLKIDILRTCKEKGVTAENITIQYGDSRVVVQHGVTLDALMFTEV